MTPRQQIANVGYAINAETLQGLPPGANTSNIPYINSQGNLLIAASNPSLASTYASSTFTHPVPKPQLFNRPEPVT